jgi:serine/threonine protein kinase
VYEAYQPFLERRAAIKVLRTDLSTVRATEEQFMHEARTIARLRHPNIVTVYEFGIAELHDKPVTYMVMEYLPGKSLRTVMRQQALNVVQIVEIVEQLARALDYAHSNNVIHRDLKPANIMFSDQNQPVIVDFGLAKLAEISTSYDHLAGDPISMAGGTPAYMSPEQCAGAPVGPASDQYSLALIVYEMLAGQAPFANVNASDLVAARLNSVPAPLSAIAPQYPPRADRVLQRALRTDPGLRYPTAADFARDLSEALVPDRVASTTITISDPLQAAELRKAQQTVLGFLWGVILVTFVVVLFCSVLYLRGYLNGDSPFIWDGIVASNSIRDGYRDVLALWPGSPAQMAGVQPGDQIKTDIFYDNTEQDGDFSVNGQPRSRYPVHWHPQEGDVVARTVVRNGQPVRVSYPLVRSAFNLIVLAVQLPPAVLAFACAWWLLRRWRTEPGGQIGTMLLMAASFALVASGVTDVITNIDSLAMYILLPLLLHLTLVFPEPIRYLRDHPKMIRWLYLPLPLGLVEFLLGVPGFDRLNLVVYSVYSLLNLGAVIVKWGRHDLKRFRPMWLLLAAWLVASVTSLLGEALATFDDYTIVRALWGGNGLLLLAVNYGVITLGSFLAILLGTLGLHRVQMRLGHAVKTEVLQPEVFETIIMNL